VESFVEKKSLNEKFQGLAGPHDKLNLNSKQNNKLRTVSFSNLSTDMDEKQIENMQRATSKGMRKILYWKLILSIVIVLELTTRGEIRS